MMICTVDSGYDMVASHDHTTVFMYDPLILQRLFAVFGPLEKDRFSSILEPRSPPGGGHEISTAGAETHPVNRHDNVCSYIPYCNMNM